MTDAEPLPEALLEAAARAYRRLSGAAMTFPPDYFDRDRAVAMLRALDAEGLEVRPKALNEDMIASEEGA